MELLDNLIFLIHHNNPIEDTARVMSAKWRGRRGRGVIIPPSNWKRGSAILLMWFINMERQLLD